MVLMAGAACAGGLVISGTYGNAAGCKYAASHELDGDDLLVLTSQGISSYASHCAFVQVLLHGDKSIVATVLCDNEGEEIRTVGLMRLEKGTDDVDTYDIYDADGSNWGKVGKCL